MSEPAADSTATAQLTVAPHDLASVLNFEPGDESRVEVFSGISLQSALRHMEHWLANIKRETTEPDLWAQLAAEGVNPT